MLRIWPAQGATKAALVYLHGIEGHSSWFADTAQYLASGGVTTRAVDRRGSGLSKERRGDAASFTRLLQDVEEVIDDAIAKEGDVPVFLMANCWGAKLAALVSRKQSRVASKLAGLVLSSPAVAVKVDLPFKAKLEIALRCCLGSLKPLPIPLLPENFTDNPQFLSMIAEDKLRLTEATSRFFVAGFLLTLMSGKASPQIEMPILIVQSGIDDIVDIEGVERWFSLAASPDKTMELFSGARHSLDFHKEPAHYRATLLQWLLSRAALSRRGAA